MEYSQNIDQTVAFVKAKLTNAEGGHDWWHIYRVWKSARHIAGHEDVNLLVVELAALLHDIADSKFHNGDEQIGPRKAREFLETLEISETDTDHIIAIIENISFKGGKVQSKFSSTELNVVQDADRLDAIGAIGIARAFNYGGFKNHALYDPGLAPKLNMTKEEYKSSTAPTINHFYEKLLLLKDRMNTKTGKQLAEERHAFMKSYLKQFYEEWEGEK